MKPKVILPVRIPDELKRRIEAQARREHMTTSMFAWLSLSDHMDTYAVQDELRENIERQRKARVNRELERKQLIIRRAKR